MGLKNYDAKCNDCGDVQEYSRTYEEREQTPPCRACGSASTERGWFTAPMVGAMGLTGGSMTVVSPIDGSVLHGKSEYQAHMKKHDVLPTSELKGEKEYRQKEKVVENKKQRRKTLETVLKKF